MFGQLDEASPDMETSIVTSSPLVCGLASEKEIVAKALGAIIKNMTPSGTANKVLNT